MLERFERELEAIDRLWNGESVTMDGGWFRLREAKLYTRARSRPRLYVSAFGPQAAAIAGRYGDGLWTLGDPDAAPEVIDASRLACADSGKEEGKIILQAGFAWADSEEEAIEGARHWKPTQRPELYREEIWDPEDMQRRADEQMGDEEFAKEGFLIASDPAEHVERIRAIEQVGATTVCLQLIGNADPLGSIRTYRERVLPALRDGSA
jgi:coenzyme F420-dependent glucose-6-phosphate dehydrogenase